MDYVAGADVTIVVPFKVDGEYAIPDASSVFYTLRDNAGAAITGHTDQALTPAGGASDVSVLLPAAVNAKTTAVENRFLTVVFKVDNQQHEYRTSYRLIDFLTYTATPDDVRAMLGVTSKEAPASLIDLVMAYYAIAAEVTQAALDTALQAGTIQSFFANRAIVAKAALAVIPSLQLAVAQEEGTDSTKYKRLAAIDFDKLKSDLTDMIGEALDDLGDRVEVTQTLAVLTSRTDPITGV